MHLAKKLSINVFSLFAIEFTIVVWYVYMSGILRTAENQQDKKHFRCQG